MRVPASCGYRTVDVRYGALTRKGPLLGCSGNAKQAAPCRKRLALSSVPRLIVRAARCAASERCQKQQSTITHAAT